MAIVTVPGFEPPVQSLSALTSTSFEPNAFKQSCEGLAPFLPTSSDDDLWQFQVHTEAPPLLSIQS